MRYVVIAAVLLASTSHVAAQTPNPHISLFGTGEDSLGPGPPPPPASMSTESALRRFEQMRHDALMQRLGGVGLVAVGITLVGVGVVGAVTAATYEPTGRHHNLPPSVEFLGGTLAVAGFVMGLPAFVGGIVALATARTPRVEDLLPAMRPRPH